MLVFVSRHVTPPPPTPIHSKTFCNGRFMLSNSSSVITPVCTAGTMMMDILTVVTMTITMVSATKACATTRLTVTMTFLTTLDTLTRTVPMEAMRTDFSKRMMRMTMALRMTMIWTAWRTPGHPFTHKVTGPPVDTTAIWMLS